MLRLVDTIRRNQPCTCGSGRRYKHCHGALDSTPAHGLAASAAAALWEAEGLQLERTRQQGLGRPIMSAQVGANRVVVVGKGKIYTGRWQTFHDFLRDYLIQSLGAEWVQTEQRKPLGQTHIVAQWYAHAVEHAATMGQSEGIYSGPMTGAIRAFLQLAYNVYLIAHHGEGEVMLTRFLRRLKSPRMDDFTGALFETYAAATFLKAGFSLAYEEIGPRQTSCVEFVARWPKTGQLFAVEVKARLRTGDAPEAGDRYEEIRRLRVGQKLVDALRKAADHTRVVMIEVNVPDRLQSSELLAGWAAAAVEQVRANEEATQPDGSSYPPAYVFITNRPFHHNMAGLARGTEAVATGFRIADFGPLARFESVAEATAACERHAAMFALLASMKTHDVIPASFGVGLA